MVDPIARRDARNRWLAQVVEDIVEPGLPIIDTHHHLWPGLEEYQDGVYELDELAADLASGHRIVATVYLQAYANYDTDGPDEFRTVGETRHADAAADEARRRGITTQVCAGIVPFVDLRLDNAADVIAAHKAASSRVRGLRQIAYFDVGLPLSASGNKNAELYDDPLFRRGFPLLAANGLVFDACAYHNQIPSMARLARDFPDTVIVVDHLASPLGAGSYAGRREEAWREWQPLIGELAALPNVFIKVGGQGMWLAGFGWNERPAPPDAAEVAAVLDEKMRHAIDLFGPDRAMFESNFPVDRCSMSSATWWNAAKLMTESYAPHERQFLFEGTARRVYSL